MDKTVKYYMAPLESVTTWIYRQAHAKIYGRLQWPNFLDTEGIADIYKVKFVPTMYLIDAQGVMVGENLRGEALANKLAELFGEIE